MRNSMCRRGQSLVEFVLIVPLFLLIVSGLVEFGFWMLKYSNMVLATRNAARFALDNDYRFIDNRCTPVRTAACADRAVCGRMTRAAKEALALNGFQADTLQNTTPEFDEIDAARLPSIHEYVESLTQGLAKVQGASWNQPGFFQITVCSNRPGYWYEYNGQAPPQCHPKEDAGSLLSTRDTRVLVAVTYRHKFIMPFLNAIADNVVLHAEREGILERFRVERSIEVPPTFADANSDHQLGRWRRRIATWTALGAPRAGYPYPPGSRLFSPPA